MKTSVSLFFLAIVCYSCNRNNNTAPPPPLPFDTNYVLPAHAEALPQYDSANYGIFKGVTINALDSTATCKFNLYNNSREPYVLLYTNNKVRDSLVRYKTDATGYIAFPPQKDSSLIPFNASFYYAYFSSYNVGIATIQFNVTGFGKSYVMNVNLRGNQTLDAILKERSNSQVTCYEGSYSGSDSGRVCFVMSADSIIGIRASIWSPQFFKNMSTHYSGNTFTLVQGDDISGNTFTFKGTIQNNTCSGTWTKSSASSVINQFSTARTL
jgi:hypothetical protein